MHFIPTIAQRGIAARPGILGKGTELVFVLGKGVKVSALLALKAPMD